MGAAASDLQECHGFGAMRLVNRDEFGDGSDAAPQQERLVLRAHAGDAQQRRRLASPRPRTAPTALAAGAR